MVHVDLLQALRMKNENSWCLTTEESDCQGKDLTLQENINSEVIMKILLALIRTETEKQSYACIG